MTEPITDFRGEHRFLSNFYPLAGGLFTTEHLYQAAKCELAEDATFIMDAPTPGDAKRRGRTVALRPDWELIKDNVMKALVISKFLGSAELSRRLLETGDADLVEGNSWHDNYWGQCVCPTCVRRGIEPLNRLGVFLMETRRWCQHYALEYRRIHAAYHAAPTSGALPVTGE